MTREKFAELTKELNWKKENEVAWVANTLMAQVELYESWLNVATFLRVSGHYYHDHHIVYLEDITKVEIEGGFLRVHMGKIRSRFNLRIGL